MTKINQALKSWRPDEVHGTTWLRSYGLSSGDTTRYIESGILKRIGPGAFMRSEDKLEWFNLLSFLQEERKMKIHLGDVSALEVSGGGHYGRLKKVEKVMLISNEIKTIPNWLKELEGDFKFEFRKSRLLHREAFLGTYNKSGIEVKLSSRELAILEYIESRTFKNGLEDLENYMNLLSDILSAYLQELLEECRSIRVKRIFLYTADKLDLPFFKKLDISKIDLGSGNRVVVENGELDKKYKITVDRDLMEFYK